MSSASALEGKERKERKIPPEFSALYPVKDDWELEVTAQR
jgi:hypothetical protein